MPHATYDKLIELLDANNASYRLIDHEPEGQTDKVSAMRGHPMEAAAKCIVLIVKIGKKSSRFVLAVVPGKRVSTPARSRSCITGRTLASPRAMWRSGLPAAWPAPCFRSRSIPI